MFTKVSARKRKRGIRKFILRSLLVIGIVGVVVGGAVCFFLVQSKRPLYVSPVVGYKSAPGLIEDDEFAAFKKTLHEKKVDFDSVSASGSSYTVQLKNGGKVTFSTQKSILEQISSLQFILTRLTMEGKLFTQLDLRFEKPVVVMKK